MSAYFKPLLAAWVEILVGMLILFISEDIRWFYLYLMIVVVWAVFRMGDYLRKMMRIYQVVNEMKLLAIIRKLKITDEEISIIADSEREKMGETKWAELEKEMSELMANK